jgi:hypothetical protein
MSPSHEQILPECERQRKAIWHRIETTDKDFVEFRIDNAKDMATLKTQMRMASFWGSILGTAIGMAIVGAILGLVLKK